MSSIEAGWSLLYRVEVFMKGELLRGGRYGELMLYVKLTFCTVFTQQVSFYREVSPQNRSKPNRKMDVGRLERSFAGAMVSFCRGFA